MPNGPAYTKILERNRAWVAERTSEDPEFFSRRAKEHRPRYLWIGCSDARVPADVLTQTEPGEIFVHRNIANQVVATDANLAAVLQYAIDVLKVEDVVVCGHSECGGVKASITGGAPQVVDNWLAQLRTVIRLHEDELAELNGDERVMRLVELNVREQVYNLSRTTVVQEAWGRGQTLRLHGVVYRLDEGILRDVGVSIDGSPASERLAGAAPAAARPLADARAG
ncbi:carbonic anhydrase [Roseisolibacter sp. H3M3-2]|uniref:carbonic anhydrase n=1 Tax=Roseisolibacter sp. H3M3-2 TaxID=3031323 RepID=UPI0023DA3B2F|nr:carbonic anhydrase [Roseisolibacter sp. H3M3-2]MDF1505094.1 carbonic anhydrase [Roseisolibacter sp. H3M3-2]